MKKTAAAMPVNYQRQQGWTFWSMIFVMLMVLFFAYVGMQLVPIYAGNANVKNAMTLALEDGGLRSATRAQIIRKIDDQLYLDGSHEMLNYKTDLRIRRSQREFILQTVYEREVPLFFNLYVVAKFDNVETRDLTAR